MVDLKDFFMAAEFSSASTEDLDRWVERAEVRAKRTVEAVRLIDQLRTSWQTADPGKGQPYVFFVRDYTFAMDRKTLDWCEAFFARELISDLASAEKGVMDNRSLKLRPKPRPVPLGNLSEVINQPCTECEEDALVIGLHWQSCDSPYGDTWVLQLMGFCPHCGLVDRFVSRESEHRMTEYLRSPNKY